MQTGLNFSGACTSRWSARLITTMAGTFWRNSPLPCSRISRLSIERAQTTIRQHFQQWSLTAYPTEQQHQDGALIGRSPRYHYAVQLGLEALNSVVHDAPAPPAIDTTMKGRVKLIDKSWYLRGGEGIDAHMLHEPIEGMTQEDVGWMRVRYQDVMPHFYALCQGANDWGILYRRPPKIAIA